MANEIAAKIAAHRASKPVRFTKKEKADSREAIKKLASEYTDGAIKKLWAIANDKRAPANAQLSAANILIERVGGKSRVVDERETEQDEFKRMSEAELLGFICESIAGMSQESQGFIVEAILASQRGLTQDFTRTVPHDFSETEALKAEDRAKYLSQAQEGLPPLGSGPKPPRKEPRR